MLKLLNTVLWGLTALMILPASAVYAEKGKEKEAAMDFFMGDPAIKYPAQASLLTNVYARDTRSLNGNWAIKVDEGGMNRASALFVNALDARISLTTNQ